MNLNPQEMSNEEVERCLKALSLIQNRLGVPGPQDHEDFKFLVAEDGREELVGILAIMASLAAIILEGIPEICEDFTEEPFPDVDEFLLAKAVLTALREVFVHQGVTNETA